MRTTTMIRALLIALFAFPLYAHFTITPSQGHTFGGEVVTIHSEDLLPHDYQVYFDANRATSVTRVDEDTLRVIAPPHLAGTSRVTLEVFGVRINPELTFEYYGDSRAKYERFLLPVFTPPIRGAFGSEFRTDFDAINLATYSFNMGVYGFGPTPRVPTPLGPWLNPHANGELPERAPNGTPGRFIYVSKEHAVGFESNLRAYDTSRSAENFGTEIPVVRGEEFRHDTFALLGVPLDARFRKTLRLYAYEGIAVRVRGLGGTRTVQLTGSTDTFTPYYAEIADFPSGTGVTDVIIERAGVGTGVWALITVTNNETQHITTIAPR